MPYLSWMEGTLLRRYRLEDDCVLGRDPDCAVVLADQGVSRRHARLLMRGTEWWVQDLDSRNGTFLNGLAVSHPHGGRLEDGDVLRLGDWEASYGFHFPGLDHLRFLEHVGDLLREVQPDPHQGLTLLHGLELLHRSTEALLKEGLGTGMVQVLLKEALALLSAERGFVVMLAADGTRTTVHRIGDVEDRRGLSQSVMDYVIQEGTAVLSNAPLEDPRFRGSSLLELHRGALICAPFEMEGKLAGLVYLDRAGPGRPFARFDLALFQAFVRQAAVLMQHTRLAGRALGHAEIQGEILRLRTLNQRLTERSGELLAEMGSSLRWLQSYGERAHGESGVALRHQVERLSYLLDAAHHEVLLEVPREQALDASLASLQGGLEPAWRSLLEIRGASLAMEPAPAGQVWLAGPLGLHAVLGLVEPLFLGLGEGALVKGWWQEEGGGWAMKLGFPAGAHAPVPNPWTLHALQDSGILWRWNEQVLSVAFPRGIDTAPEQPPIPLLGLVSEEYELLGLFHSVAEADQLAVFPMDADPPMPPLPAFRYLVVDAKGVKDPVLCIQAYRRHPSFVTVPILVVRAAEESFPSLLAAGATDWLPEGFRWETLHHRLQVLKGHAELQQKARAAERLDALRRMAGSLKHEINNPLAVISMQVELLQRKFPEEVKLKKIEEMVDRIRGLVQVLQKMREAPSEDYPGGTDIAKLS